MTVGSISADFWSNPDKQSISPLSKGPSSFTRSGLGIWDTIKPEVVEIGGDYVMNRQGVLSPPTIENDVALELIRATGDGGPAIAKDDVGTSYAAAKVSHIAAQLEGLFPDSPALLYRGLIVHTARWPNWFASSGWTVDRALRLMGFGMPSLQRAIANEGHRVTLITPKSETIRNQGLHLYRVAIPRELRALAEDVVLRIDVTLSYSSEPRRTRSSRRGYLATWLDWRSSGLGEPLETFHKRMVSGEEKPDRAYPQFDWCLHYSTQHGEASETHRGNGTVQKDWAFVSAHELPEEIGIAVRGHKGWDHRESSGGANYCLIVSIEAQNRELRVYNAVSEVNIPIETEITERVNVLGTAPV